MKRQAVTRSATNGMATENTNAAQQTDGWTEPEVVQRPSCAPKILEDHFSGLAEEDPELFLQACEAFFKATGCAAITQVEKATQRLKGEARRWWLPHSGGRWTWADFGAQLRQRYGTEAARSSLLVSLYGDHQNDGESGISFLQRKKMVHERLNGEQSLDGTCPDLIALMRPRYRELLEAGLVFGNYTFETLKARVSAIDFPRQPLFGRQIPPSEVHAMALPPQQPRREKAPEPAARMEQRQQPPVAQGSRGHQPWREPLPRCQYCPGRHLNRDCRERNEYLERRAGNARRPGGNWNGGPAQGRRH